MAASGTKKGRASGFAGRLAKEAVIIGDLSAEPEVVKLWLPRTDGDARTPRRDGYLTDGYNHEVLDIASHGDSCCVSPNEAAEADSTWAEGSVLITNADWEENRPALVLPRRSAPVEWIGEALTRHFGTAVSPPELVA